MNTPYLLSDQGDIQYEVDGMYLILKLKPGVISGLGGGTIIDIIKSIDQKEATDLNVYSALRTKNNFLSKINDDVALGKLTLQKGIQIGPEFVHGLLGTGGLIDQSGNAELESLTLRRFLEVPELRYNRVEINIGDKWNAPGGGIVQSVDTVNKIINLKLEEGEIGTIKVDDICMGIYHSSTSMENEPLNRDDSLGNRTFSGFATVYFKITEILETGKNSSFRYELRPMSASWGKQIDPFQAMHFVAYGNFTDTSRQTSRYSTRTYERYLKGVNNWEFTGENIGAQFGDLTNLSVFGLTMTGYSAYLNNIYMSGTIQQFDIIKPIVVKYSSVTSPGNPTDNPLNWTDTSDANTIWMAVQTYKNGVASAWDILSTRGPSGISGDKTVYVFKNSASAPSTPTGTAVPPSGWLSSISGAGTWWVSTAIVDGATGLAGKLIGGTNLYKRAQQINSLLNNPTVSKSESADSQNGFKIVGKNGLATAVRMPNIITKNGSYVVSFWGKANGGFAPSFNMCDVNMAGDQSFSSTWKKYELTVTITNYSIGTFNFLDIEAIPYVTMWIKDFKVEEGFTSTEWCVNPDDIWSIPVRFNGDDSLSMTLSNTTIGVSCNSSGTPKSGELGASGRAVTTVKVFKGTTELLLGTDWSFNAITDSNVTHGQVTGSLSTIYVDTMTGDLGYIDIQVAVGSELMTRRFSVNKVYDGAQGVGGVSMVLTNDSCNVLCDSEGAPLSGELGSSGKAITEVKVYLGGALKTYGTDWQFLNNYGTGCTWGQISGQPKIYLNSLQASSGQVEINIQLLGVQMQKVFTFSKTITGAQGLQGMLVRQTEHAIGFEYRNDENLTSAPRYLDVVTSYISGVFRIFKCKITHTSTSSTQPPNTTYWEEFNQTSPIYTSLILSTNAVIRFLQGNQAVMQKADGTVTAGMSGAGSGATGIRFWAGGPTPGTAPYRVNELGDIFANNGTFKGSFATPFSTNYTITEVSSTLYRTYLSFTSGFNFVFTVPDLGTTLEVYLPNDVAYSGVDCWLCMPYITKSGGNSIIKVNGGASNIVTIDSYGTPTFLASIDLFWIKHLKAINIGTTLYWFVIR